MDLTRWLVGWLFAGDTVIFLHMRVKQTMDLTRIVYLKRKNTNAHLMVRINCDLTVSHLLCNYRKYEILEIKAENPCNFNGKIKTKKCGNCKVVIIETT